MRVHITTGPGGQRHVYLQESYRDEMGRPRHRTVERLGRLDDLLALDPDALDKLRARARAAPAPGRGALPYDVGEPSGDEALNIGWFLVDAILKASGIAADCEERFAAHANRPTDAREFCTEIARRALRQTPATFPGGAVIGPAPADLFSARRSSDPSGIDRVLELAGLAIDGIDLPLARLRAGTVVYATRTAVPIPADSSSSQGQRAGGQVLPDVARCVVYYHDERGLPIGFLSLGGSVPDGPRAARRLSTVKDVFQVDQVVGLLATPMKRDVAQAFADSGHGWISVVPAPLEEPAAVRWALSPEGWADGGSPTVRVKHEVVTSIRRLSHGGADSPQSASLRIARHCLKDAAQDQAERARRMQTFRSEEEVDPPLAVHVMNSKPEATDGLSIIETSQTESTPEEILTAVGWLRRTERSILGQAVMDVHEADGRLHPAHSGGLLAAAFLAAGVTKLLELWLGPAVPPGDIHAALVGLTVQEGDQGVYLVSRPAAWDAIDQVTGAGFDVKWATPTSIRRWRDHLVSAAEAFVSDLRAARGLP